jgi:hypothetical protein
VQPYSSLTSVSTSTSSHRSINRDRGGTLAGPRNLTRSDKLTARPRERRLSTVCMGPHAWSCLWCGSGKCARSCASAA